MHIFTSPIQHASKSSRGRQYFLAELMKIKELMLCFTRSRLLYSYESKYIFINKTLYGALTRWGYLNTHITAHDTYSIQLFQLRLSPSKAEKCERSRIAP